MINKHSIKLTLSWIALIVLIVSSISAQTSTGKQNYNKYCLSCHGLEGKGDGQLSYLLYPKPRDLTSGLFKIRSTKAGNPPTDTDLFTTIERGMPGTAMPSFNFLDPDELKDIVSYIKDLGNINNSHSVPIQIPDEISKTNELLKLGKSIYTEIGCNKCHGETGKGDGPSSNALVDSRGYPTIPRDFTSGVYLGGGQTQDLYLRFVGGMDGTPMPAYGNLSELLGKPKEDEKKLAWSLVHYVKSLETGISEEAIKTPEDGKITALAVSKRTKSDKLLDASSSVWNKADSYSIPISRLWQSDNVNYQVVEVQAVYNSKYIAIKLEWEDLTSDASLYRVQDFQDAAAIQFSIDGTMDFHGMGSRDHPTDIWFWKSEWQMQKNSDTDSNIELAYVNRVSDSDVEHYPNEFNDTAFLGGRDAGNINSRSERNSSVENVSAVGPQTVTTNPDKLQRVQGKGTWDGEKWRVVFLREMTAVSDQEIKFNKNVISSFSDRELKRAQSYIEKRWAPDNTINMVAWNHVKQIKVVNNTDTEDVIPIGFAVWNGSENDRNGQKMVSTWYQLELKD